MASVEQARALLRQYDQVCAEYQYEQEQAQQENDPLRDAAAYEGYEDSLMTLVHELADELRSMCSRLAQVQPHLMALDSLIREN